ncbi:unnamed protein product, partial [Rotaria sp. Silwood1]
MNSTIEINFVVALTPLTIDTTTPKEPEKLGNTAALIAPDLDQILSDPTPWY